MSNIIDSIQVSGTVYQIQGSGGGNPTVELTQEQYDALVSAGTVSPTTYYIITDATPIDVSNYWTSAQTQSAITAAVSGKASQSDLLTVSGQVANKQDTLVSGTNIKTINNESILGSGNIDIQGGGGKAVSAGTNISITTGETADTINCTLPISGDSKGIYTTSSYPFEGISIKSQNVVFGLRNKINKNSSSSYCTNNLMFGEDNTIGTGEYTAIDLKNNFVGGSGNIIYAASTVSSSFITGFHNEIRNLYETAFGIYNVSNTGSTNADNTLFSVGNGTLSSARHNAFEIRNNGDIYINKDGSDIKLQDNLGGAASSAITSGDTNAVAGGAVYNKFDEVEQVTAAALNVLNDKFGGLKLQQISQSDYDALVSGGTVDSSTLYIITNVVS